MNGDFNDSDEEALKRYERRITQDKKSKREIKTEIAGHRESSPSLAERFINFIGCGAKTKPNK